MLERSLLAGCGLAEGGIVGTVYLLCFNGQLIIIDDNRIMWETTDTVDR